MSSQLVPQSTGVLSVLHGLADALCVTDAQGRVIFVNDQFERLAGRSGEDLINQPIWLALAETIGPVLQQCLRDPLSAPLRFNHYLPSLDRCIEANVTPAPSGLAFVFRDVVSPRLCVPAAGGDDSPIAVALCPAAPAAERQLRLVTDALPVLISYVGPNHRFRWANAQYRDWFGVTTEQIAGMHMRDLLGEQVYNHRRQYVDTALTGRTLRFEGPTIHRRMGSRISDVLYVPDVLDDGTVQGLFVLVQDITDRRRGEQALLESEQRFRATFEQAAVGIAHVGLDGRWLRVNRRYGQIVGYAVDELRAVTFQDITHPDDLDADLAQAQRLLNGEIDSYAMQKRYIRKDGAIVWVNLTASLVRDPAGAPAYFVAVAEDITSRKGAEQAARESEQFTRRVLDNLFAFVGVLEPDGTLIEANAAPLRAAGITLEQVRGRKFWDCYWWNYCESVANQLRDACARAARGESVRYDVVVRMAGEARMVIDFQIAPLRGPDGRITHLIPTAVDVTDRTRIAGELRQAKESAESANQAKDHFLAVLSHELRTPLNPALMAAALLETSPQLPADLREDAAVIRRNVELEARLIDDLLDLTRIARGKLTLSRRLVDGRAVLRDAIQTCQAEAQEKNLELQVVLPPAPIGVDADPARLQQVFWNLLKNAIKFTPEKGQVQVTAERGDSGGLRVTMRDTGRGIDPAHMGRIFDAFEQVEACITRQYGGLGLGLAICRGLVEMHGGTITAHSDGPGRGACFIVELPPTAPSNAPWTPAVIDRPQSQRAGHRILLVEDHEATAKVTARLLRSFGHDVILASTVRGALATYRRGDFDLLISDVGLPDGTGHDLLRQLRRERSVQAIALSGYGMEEDLIRSRDAGFAEHLVKPIDFRHLLAAIERLATAR